MNYQQTALVPLGISDFFIFSIGDERLLRLDDLKRFTYFAASISIYSVSLTTGDSENVFRGGGSVAFDKPWRDAKEFNYDYATVVSRLEERTLDAYNVRVVNHDNKLAIISPVTEYQYGDMMVFVRRFGRLRRLA